MSQNAPPTPPRRPRLPSVVAPKARPGPCPTPEAALAQALPKAAAPRRAPGPCPTPGAALSQALPKAAAPRRARSPTPDRISTGGRASRPPEFRASRSRSRSRRPCRSTQNPYSSSLSREGRSKKSRATASSRRRGASKTDRAIVEASALASEAAPCAGPTDSASDWERELGIQKRKRKRRNERPSAPLPLRHAAASPVRTVAQAQTETQAQAQEETPSNWLLHSDIFGETPFLRKVLGEFAGEQKAPAIFDECKASAKEQTAPDADAITVASTSPFGSRIPESAPTVIQESPIEMPTESPPESADTRIPQSSDTEMPTDPDDRRLELEGWKAGVLAASAPYHRVEVLVYSRSIPLAIGPNLCSHTDEILISPSGLQSLQQVMRERDLAQDQDSMSAEQVSMAQELLRRANADTARELVTAPGHDDDEVADVMLSLPAHRDDQLAADTARAEADAELLRLALPSPLCASPESL